jgi:transcriptional regulator with XRE-family HTH domain
MEIGNRLRIFREARNLSQGDVEKSTGLLRCYISRVENGHTVPAVETLEKFARALDVPMYQLFYTGKTEPEEESGTPGWGTAGKDARMLSRLRRHLAHTSATDQKLLLTIAQQMSRKNGRRAQA